ncbi:MAG TPA: tetratricopeptide repeat protein [Thermoanaerobaculia bacterium]|jgi:tetratricopeptide (TPR) repeat protein|nr:tetratricopeptide repeat protein [Thermoanaerobaculia bacterium]
MADPAAEARIRDLERRLDLDSGSRLFVSLAEEYRKVGRIKDALSALQKGLLAHPGYVAAQVALGRAYLEANQATDAIATFTKVLVADPANLVAAKSLADIHLGRNDNLEALKKFKLYRAISGDRKVDEMIAKLEPLVAPRPLPPPRKPVEQSLPPPPKFQETDKGRRRTAPKTATSVSPPLADAFELTSVSFEVGEDSGTSKAEDPFPFMPTRDQAIAPAPDSRPAPAPAVPAAFSFSEERSVPAPAMAPETTPPASAPEPPAADLAVAEPTPAAEPVRPTGRALADLYYAQGHYAEALQIYDDLVTRHPFDEDLKRMRRDAEARLLPAATAPASAIADAGLELRLSRIRALKQWLSLVQAG